MNIEMGEGIGDTIGDGISDSNDTTPRNRKLFLIFCSCIVCVFAFGAIAIGLLVQDAVNNNEILMHSPLYKILSSNISRKWVSQNDDIFQLTSFIFNDRNFAWSLNDVKTSARWFFYFQTNTKLSGYTKTMLNYQMDPMYLSSMQIVYISDTTISIQITMRQSGEVKNNVFSSM
jgi:hypothetical protein